MRKLTFLAVLLLPTVVFAGGYYMPETSQSSSSSASTTTYTTPAATTYTTPAAVTPVQTTNVNTYYEPALPMAVDPVDPAAVELAPQVQDFTPWYQPMSPQTFQNNTGTNSNAPLWWSRTYNQYTAPVERTNSNSMEIYQTKQQQAQEKLLRYRTFMR